MKSQENLPTKKDFDPWGDLDAQWAWKNFGGLTIDSAYNKFCTYPETYQEDFMFMGPTAFSFYFSIIEKYMSTVQPEDEFDDCSGWIIGCGVEIQLENIESECLKQRVLRLVDIVINRFINFPIEDDDKLRVIEKWKEIKTKIQR
jgi:hypothetical protein